MSDFVWSFLLLLLCNEVLVFVIDVGTPNTLNTPLKFCPYNETSCCNSTEDLQLQKQFQAMNISDPGCASVLKSVLCAVRLSIFSPSMKICSLCFLFEISICRLESMIIWSFIEISLYCQKHIFPNSYWLFCMFLTLVLNLIFFFLGTCTLCFEPLTPISMILFLLRYLIVKIRNLVTTIFYWGQEPCHGILTNKYI